MLELQKLASKGSDCCRGFKRHGRRIGGCGWRGVQGTEKRISDGKLSVGSDMTRRRWGNMYVGSGIFSVDGGMRNELPKCKTLHDDAGTTNGNEKLCRKE